jgi:hypothetical protein
MPQSGKDTDLFRALVHQANVVFPNVPVTTCLFEAGTGAGPWRIRGNRVRQLPVPDYQ